MFVHACGEQLAHCHLCCGHAVDQHHGLAAQRVRHAAALATHGECRAGALAATLHLWCCVLLGCQVGTSLGCQLIAALHCRWVLWRGVALAQAVHVCACMRREGVISTALMQMSAHSTVLRDCVVACMTAFFCLLIDQEWAAL